MDDEPKSAQTARDWPELREWANFAVAGAALLVSIVSIWTTAQISGVEDYFRSEIEFRNSELSDARRVAASLDAQIRDSSSRLVSLQSNADRLSLLADESQLQLASAQNEILATRNQASGLLLDQQKARSDLIAAEDRLELIAIQVDRQEKTLESYRIEEVLSNFRTRFSFFGFLGLFDRGDDETVPISGAAALREMENFELGLIDAATLPYYERIRTLAPKLCRTLATFQPYFPDQMATPKLDPLKGKRDEDGSVWAKPKEIPIIPLTHV